MKKRLIVEDEAVLQKSLANKITREGWEAIPALNGEEGLARIEAEKPDLVLLDLRMPKMEGMEMLKKAREKYNKRDLPVIILTNYEEGENVGMALDLGADIFLVKANYSLTEIVDKIKEVLKIK